MNLCKDDVAAHFTPGYDSEEKAEGLLKIDFDDGIQGTNLVPDS